MSHSGHPRETAGLASQQFWEADYLASVSLPARPDSRVPFDRELAAALERHAPVGRGQCVLEVGCAPAKWLALYAERFGAQVSGIEYTAHGVELSRRNLLALGVPGEVRHEDFFHAHVTPVDLVLSLGFIEHFEDLEGAFARHVEFVAPGGAIVIGVPNYRGVLGAIQRLMNREHLDLHNLRAMVPALYTRLAAKHGLVVERQLYLDGPDPAILKPGRRWLMPLVVALELFRKLPGSERLNNRWLSAYLLTVVRRPVSSETR